MADRIPALLARWSVLASLAAAIGCVGGEEASSAEIATPDADAPVFFKYGTPGRWTRPDATRADFEQESRGCLERSSAARRDARPGGGTDAAYRAYLECMQEHRWRRTGRPASSDGATPRSARAPRGTATATR
jgi:hypothetical protein